MVPSSLVINLNADAVPGGLVLGGLYCMTQEQGISIDSLASDSELDAHLQKPL